jgi:enterochelin esterase-like enzyme
VSATELTDVAPPHARLRVEDPDGRYRAVRLVTDLYKRDPPQAFTRRGHVWELRVPLPAVDRFEYLLQVVDANGDLALVLDPDAPTASGPFGPKSVFEVPGYEPPEWLGADGPAGTITPLALESARLGAIVRGLLWTPAGADGNADLPLLVAHDGPEYAEHSSLLRYLAWAVETGVAPRHRAALLAPVRRNDHYAASPRYSAALVEELLPTLGARGPVVGVGASLGGLALLHAHCGAPGAFAGLLLQSGSFFQPATDPWEQDFPRFGPITRFVGRVLRGRDCGTAIPITLTCGTAEENLANNRALRNALARLGYDVELALVRDAHTWAGWRDSLHPHLSRLLARAWR